METVASNETGNAGSSRMQDGISLNHLLREQVRCTQFEEVGLLLPDGNFSVSNLFLVDDIPPTVTSVSPSDQDGVNDEHTAIVAVLNDDGGSDIDGVESTIEVTTDANPVAGETAWDSGTGELSFTPGAPLAEGTYTVTATPQDKAGNVGEPTTVTFYLDLTDPVISSVTPANASSINTSMPTLSWVLTDAFTGVDVDSAVYSLEDSLGNSVSLNPGSWDTETNTLSTTPAALLTDDTYTLTITVADNAGNESTSTTAFVIDITPPVIAADDPTRQTDISNLRNTTLSAAATETIDWTVTVEDPFNRVVATFTANDTDTFGP